MTSIEWLERQLKIYGTITDKGGSPSLETMFNLIELAKETVEDDVEKLAEQDTIALTDYLTEKEHNCMKLGFVRGYNKAKETLYTEEQVREAMNCTVLSAKAKERVIQSLKQPKKD